MDLNIKLKLLLLIAIQIISVQCSFNMTEYYKMPPLYQMDDYDRCLSDTKDESIYCYVISEIVPNNSIPLWNQIHEFSSFKSIHYQHDKLVNGICINRCKDIILNLSENDQKKFYAGKLTDLQLNTHINNLYSSHNDRRLKYNKLINQCLNYNFTRNYNLMLRSNIENCVSNKDTIKIELMDIIFILIIGLIFLLTFGSSYYDFKLKQKLHDEIQKKEHYKKSVSDKRKLLYLTFSICRNYYRLVAPSKDHTYFAKDLRFLEAFRVFMMLGVLTNHMFLGLNAIGYLNPQFIESTFHSFIKCILTNGTLIMQTFFTMSGFLLTIIYDEQEKKTKNQNYTGTFIKYVVLRFIRLTPIYALAILFATTWYTKLGDGPYWNHGTETDKVYCKKYWWANLLYINNYVGTDQLCLGQAWYLGVDFQLFIMSILILMFISRFPKSKYFIFVIGYLISMVAIIISYFKVEFQGIYIATPEFLRYAVVLDVYFLQFFIPAHTNMGGYLAGIMFGKIYIDMKQRNYNLGDNKKFVLTWYLVIVVGFIVIFSAEILYIYDLNEKTLLMGIYLAFSKNLYAILSGIILLGMSFKIGWIGYEFSILPMFRILGRLTYCAFIIHAFVVRLPSGEYYQPVRITVMLVITQLIGKLFITYLLSFFVTLLFEFPISSIMKILLMGGSDGRPKKKQEIEEINGGPHGISKVENTTVNVA